MPGAGAFCGILLEWPVRALAFGEDGALYAAEVFETIVGDEFVYESRISRLDGRPARLSPLYAVDAEMNLHEAQTVLDVAT